LALRMTNTAVVLGITAPVCWDCISFIVSIDLTSS
jgi:hypothetical protein